MQQMIYGSDLCRYGVIRSAEQLATDIPHPIRFEISSPAGDESNYLRDPVLAGLGPDRRESLLSARGVQRNCLLKHASSRETW